MIKLALLRHAAVAAAALMASAGLAAAQPAEGVITDLPVRQATRQDDALGADELAQAVIDHNAGLTARELMVRAKRELIDSAGALDDPRVNYAVAPTSAGDAIPSAFGDALGIRQVYQVSQSIPWPGKLALRTDLAEAEAAIEQYSHEALLLTLVSQTRVLWSQLWYLDRALSTNAGHQQLLADLEEVAATRYAAGRGPQENLLRIQTARVEVQRQETTLVQQRRRIQERLNGLLNHSSTIDVERPAGELPQRELPQTTMIRQWMLEQHPELQRLEAQSQAASTRLRLAEKNDFPDFQLGAGYNELWNDSSQRFQVSISVNIPLDLGGKRSARKAAADYEYSSTLADLEHRKSEIEAELEQQLSRHDELMENIALYETQLLPVAEETFNAANANYEGGGGNFATLVEAQRRLLNLQLELERMRSERVSTLAEIDQLSGGMMWPLEEVQ